MNYFASFMSGTQDAEVSKSLCVDSSEGDVQLRESQLKGTKRGRVQLQVFLSEHS